MGEGNNLSVNRNSPVVDYTSVDFDGSKEDLIAYAQAKFPDRWTDFNSDQFATVMLELMCYLHDLSSYQLNAVLREGYVATVLRRQNLITLGKPYDFAPEPPKASSVDLVATLDPTGSYPFTISPTDHQFSNGNDLDEVFFTPISEQEVVAYSPSITISCVEGEHFGNQVIGVSTGLPSQRWQLPQENVLVDSIVVVVGAETWTKATRNNLVYSQSTDRHYKVIYDDENRTFVIFGDGSYGQIPANNAQIRATFRVGGGRRGNLGPNTIETIVSANSAILSVTNPERSSGGDEAQSMRSARNAIPATIRTLERAVTPQDHADVALTVSGVAKARSVPGIPSGSRNIDVLIAPNGGGVPSAVLKNTVLNAFRTKKMVTSRIRLKDPLYRTLRFYVLLHIDPSFRASDVQQQVRRTVINSSGTGIFDFDQLDFAALTTDANGLPELLLSQTRLQGHFERLVNVGLDRAEIYRLDVVPVAREREAGNVGTGTISDGSIILNGKQRRREYFIYLTSATTYSVYERITGFVSELTDTTLTDDTKVFDEEGVFGYSGWKLVPRRGTPVELDVISASDQKITVSGGLFTLADKGGEYYLYNPFPANMVVGDQFSNSDGSVRFTLTAGGTPFINGDSFTIDVFPMVSDLILRPDEYPLLDEVDFVTRTAGGSRT